MAGAGGAGGGGGDGGIARGSGGGGRGGGGGLGGGGDSCGGGGGLVAGYLRGIWGSQYPGIRNDAGRAGTVLHARGTERRFGLTYIEQK